MRKLLAGVYKFKTEIYPERRELFAELSSSQSPRILFITCSDSRIDPNLVTQAPPGDLFICRNAGNIVPPHERNAGGTTASLEFAVAALKVRHVVVCGHTDCGAIKGAMHPENLTELPHVSDWLSHTRAALSAVRARNNGIRDEHLSELTEENVVLQLRHLMTHPAVAAAEASGQLSLHGWIYDIGRGDIRCYDERDRVWQSVEDVYRNDPELASEIAEGLPAHEH
jgi:carbonic anhydrase